MCTLKWKSRTLQTFSFFLFAFLIFSLFGVIHQTLRKPQIRYKSLLKHYWALLSITVIFWNIFKTRLKSIPKGGTFVMGRPLQKSPGDICNGKGPFIMDGFRKSSAWCDRFSEPIHYYKPFSITTVPRVITVMDFPLLRCPLSVYFSIEFWEYSTKSQ